MHKISQDKTEINDCAVLFSEMSESENMQASVSAPKKCSSNSGGKSADSVDSTPRNTCSISNKEVIDLVFSMFKEFFDRTTGQQLCKLEKIENGQQTMHEIVCKTLRFPAESVLKGTFSTGSFRIDVIEDSVKDKIQRKCELNNITVEYVLNVTKSLKHLSFFSKVDKLCEVVCAKANVTEDLIDKYALETKVKGREGLVNRLKKNKQRKKIDCLMKSVFYLPVRKKDLMKELQETPENVDFYFLQNRNTEPINGVVVDVFEALKGDLAEVRKVLCSRFTKVQQVKVRSLKDYILNCVKKADCLVEAGKTEELEKFMNLSFLESSDSRHVDSVTQTKISGKENKATKEMARSDSQGNDSDLSVSDDCLNTYIKKEDGSETEDLAQAAPVAQISRNVQDEKTLETVGSTCKNDNNSINMVESSDCFTAVMKKEVEDGTEMEDQNSVSDTCEPCENSDVDEEENIELDIAEEEDEDYNVERDCKKRKRKAYDNAFKLIVVQFAEKEGNRAAERKFRVLEKNVRYWRKNKKLIEEAPKTKKRKIVSRPKGVELMEKDLKKWFLYYQGKGTVLTQKLVMIKARALATEAKYKIDTKRFVFGQTWCAHFMQKNNLKLSRKKNNIAGKEMDFSCQEELLNEAVGLETDEESFDDKLRVDAQDQEHEGSCTDSENKEVPSVERNNEEMKQNRATSDIKGAGCENPDLIFGNGEKAIKNEGEASVLPVSLEGRTDSSSKSDVGVLEMRQSTKKKSRSYSLSFKLSVVKFAEESSKSAAAREFDVSENLVDKWCKSGLSAEDDGRKKSRVPAELEKELVAWVKDMQSSGSHITGRAVAEKARFLCHNKAEYSSELSDFKFTYNWYTKFMRKHGLPMFRKKDKAQFISEGEKNYSPPVGDTEELPDWLKGVPHQTDSSKNSRKAYDNAFKRTVISFAESSSNVLARKAFNLSEKVIRDWRKRKNIIMEGPKHKKRIVVRPPVFKELEQELAVWYKNLLTKQKSISKKALILKAKQLANKGTYSIDMSDFKASNGWCKNFLRRNGYISISDSCTREENSEQKEVQQVVLNAESTSESSTEPGCAATSVRESDRQSEDSDQDDASGFVKPKEMSSDESL